MLIHIVDRRTWKQVKTRYVTDPFFFMHVANAYEDGEHIVLDLPTYKDSTLLHKMFISTLRASIIEFVGVRIIILATQTPLAVLQKFW